MEELKQTIIEAVKEGMKKAYAEMGNIDNTIQLIDGKDPNELLTVEQAHKEFDIGLGTMQKVYKDPKLDAQRYTTPYKATRRALYRYFNEEHDYLSKRK